MGDFAGVRFGALVVLAVGLVLGGTAFLAAQPHPGATVDSGEYLAVADGIAQGEGLTMPYVGYDERFRVLEPGERVTLTQFPPLYPALVATTGVAGMSSLDGARLLGALSFAVTGWVVAGLVLAETRARWPVAIAGALLLTADLVIVHSMAWSETVMLAAFVSALAFTVRYIRSGRTLDLVVAGGWAVVASSARFVGLAAVAAIALAVLTSGNGSVARRLVRGASFAAICVLPTAAWFVRNASILGSPSEKEIGWYLPGWSHVVQGLSTFGGWLIPWKGAMPFVGTAVLVALVVAGCRGLLSRRSKGPWSGVTACAVFGGCYFVFVFLSRTVLDQNIAFDFRILSPLYVVIAVALCVKAPGLGRVATIALIALSLMAVARGAMIMGEFSSSSVASYTGDDWKGSPTLAEVNDLPADTLVITNAPDPIWIWHGRVSQIIPPRSSLYSGEPNEAYSADIRAIHRATACRDAVVAFFDQPTRKPRRYIEPLLVRILGLEKTDRFSDGEIYEVSELPCPSA